jgi:hypothetical protein
LEIHKKLFVSGWLGWVEVPNARMRLQNRTLIGFVAKNTNSAWQAAYMYRLSSHITIDKGCHLVSMYEARSMDELCPE